MKAVIHHVPVGYPGRLALKSLLWMGIAGSGDRFYELLFNNFSRFGSLVK